MKIVYFTHSLVSCWNHGNAHFLRGVLRELTSSGHEVIAWEPSDSWSLANLLADHGEAALAPFRAEFPALQSGSYGAGADVAELCDGADLVLVHEWNDPDIVAAIGRLRRTQRFILLFHDTHHRAMSDPASMRALDLSWYDGVLAFGDSLAQVYRRWGWGSRVWVWHEAADTRLFHPPETEIQRSGIVWIGNWGDGERSEELVRFLLAPTAAAGLSLDIYGVRYSDWATALLARYGAQYRGWVANVRAPAVFANHLATVHVPRRFYVETLPGIPTIRIFEALACGIPLLSAPWEDSEHLFSVGSDFLVAADGVQARRHLTALSNDAALRAHLAKHGLQTILARHTCAHRAGELLQIVEALRVPEVGAVR
jgi:spore maturation protein CgeB